MVRVNFLVTIKEALVDRKLEARPLLSSVTLESVSIEPAQETATREAEGPETERHVAVSSGGSSLVAG